MPPAPAGKTSTVGFAVVVEADDAAGAGLTGSLLARPGSGFAAVEQPASATTNAILPRTDQPRAVCQRLSRTLQLRFWKNASMYFACAAPKSSAYACSYMSSTKIGVPAASACE